MTQLDAQQLLDQIGRMRLMSVGARGFESVSNPDGTGYLAFVISRGHRKVYITLNAMDTYDVRTKMIRSGKVVFERNDVYAEDISEMVWQAHLER